MTFVPRKPAAAAAKGKGTGSAAGRAELTRGASKQRAAAASASQIRLCLCKCARRMFAIDRRRAKNQHWPLLIVVVGVVAGAGKQPAAT